MRDLAWIARVIYSNRRKRTKWFPEAELGEPYWDILLDLYAAEFEGRPVSISSACLAASVPPTTGLRWVKKMIADGVIERIASPSDQRVSYVRLSSEAQDQMTEYLRAHGHLPAADATGP